MTKRTNLVAGKHYNKVMMVGWNLKKHRYFIYFFANFDEAVKLCKASDHVHNCGRWLILFKVENILKGSLDLIPSPSPSVKIQIMGGKVCLRCKSKTLLGDVNKLFVFKSLLTTPRNVLPLHLKQTFPLII